MRALLLLLSCVLGLTYKTAAQRTDNYELLGSHVDMDGQIIHSYADPDYNPLKPLALKYNSADYIPGCYYDAEGNQFCGEILRKTGDGFVSENMFRFRRHETDKSQKIKPQSGWSVKIGTDSFIVASRFIKPRGTESENLAYSEPHMLLYLGKSAKWSLFSCMPMGNTQPQYFLRFFKTNHLIELPATSKPFIEAASLLLVDYPQLLKLIISNEIKPNQVTDLLRFMQLSDALLNNSRLGFTANWEITTVGQSQEYTADVSQQDDTWKLNFYNKANQKIFTESYSLAKPSEKYGEVLWYYPATGVTRKKTNLLEGESDKTVYVYHPNGQLHYKYFQTPYNQQIYKEVYASEGQSLLDEKGMGSESFVDEITGRTIYRTFKSHKLESSYFVDGENKKFYQYASRNAHISQIIYYSGTFSEYAKYPKDAIEAGIDGLVLVKFIIGQENKIEDLSILKGLCTSIDQEVLRLFKNESLGLKVKSGKHDKQQVHQEIIVPVSLTLLKQSPNRYYHHNHYWMNPIHHTPPVPVNPPSMPRM